MNLASLYLLLAPCKFREGAESNSCKRRSIRFQIDHSSGQSPDFLSILILGFIGFPRIPPTAISDHRRQKSTAPALVRLSSSLSVPNCFPSAIAHISLGLPSNPAKKTITCPFFSHPCHPPIGRLISPPPSELSGSRYGLLVLPSICISKAALAIDRILPLHLQHFFRTNLLGRVFRRHGPCDGVTATGRHVPDRAVQPATDVIAPHQKLPQNNPIQK
ncbi:hypothetical protein J3A83DRAFT_2837656 [Scleroderma citrinum]